MKINYVRSCSEISVVASREIKVYMDISNINLGDRYLEHNLDRLGL